MKRLPGHSLQYLQHSIDINTAHKHSLLRFSHSILFILPGAAAIRLLLSLILLTALIHAANGSHARRDPVEDDGTDAAELEEPIDAEIMRVDELDLEDAEDETVFDAENATNSSAAFQGAAPDSVEPAALPATALPLSLNASVDVSGDGEKGDNAIAERSAAADEDELDTPHDGSDPNLLAIKEQANLKEAHEDSGPLEDYDDPNWIESKASANA